MKTIRTVAALRHELMPHDGTLSIGLVPTMGAFHEGHLSLMRAARERCDLVVVSLFVNPTQFDETADLAAYPRHEARDAALAAEEGVDVLFAPPVEEVYPDGFATTVRVEGLTTTLEGAHRPGHFDGVATVVAKLFNMVAPDVAFFGQKDAQQAAVIRRLVRDLDLPVEIDVRPTVRDADGLALSSRNQRLSPGERHQALTLVRALRNVAVAANVGGTVEDALALGRRAMVEEGVEPEYLVAVRADTLAPAQSFEEGDVLVAVAARVGEVRLIDNILVSAVARAHADTDRGVPCNA
ncbi:MAG: pantoate--beta-alanine ligase [Solirubrobacteraceae bacterium]|jgi:pantoate--beta-alanine ligase|nr:pantoate--beta-alanine ligase [Solirubrobacteraceae bacterium]